MAQESELSKVVTVLCSATKCRFKTQNGYYGRCHNPSVLSDYSHLVGGRVLVSDCGHCNGCTSEICALKAFQVSQVSGGKLHEDCFYSRR